MVGSRPLYDNLADSRLFIRPPQWEAVRRAVKRRLNVAVVGHRGVGKTTLLRQLQLAQREAGTEVVFVDATAVENVGELATRIRDALAGQPGPLADGASLAVEAFRRQDTPLAGASRVLASLLREIGEAPASLVLVDGSASAQACHGLFGRMRDVLWQQPHRWVLALEESDRATALKPPADAFFDTVVELEPWPADELFELLERRADEGEPWSRQLLVAAAHGAHGNPREAVRALSDALVHGRDPVSGLAAREHLETEASRLGRPAGMLMVELLQREQASPSDENLQHSLGVTRSRLNQLFRQLQGHGLVRVETERADGPGRPRAIYRPALPR
jgi:energy-coupling factor transporter ATP-binding protein EcfA2